MDDLLQYAAAITAIAAALAAVTKWVVGPVIRTLRRLRDFLDDWNGEGERPGVPARPGVMARIGTIEVRIAAIDHQLHPNSGESLRDQVDATRALVEGITEDDNRKEN